MSRRNQKTSSTINQNTLIFKQNMKSSNHHTFSIPSRSSILLPFIGVLSIALSSSAQECPPPWIPDPEAFGEGDYIASRQKCQDACIADGYCCTLGNGGCAKVPCTTGCHIAFFSSTLDECYNQCAAANSNNCYYTHERHPDVAHLGWNPTYTASGGVDAVATCGGPAS